MSQAVGTGYSYGVYINGKANGSNGTTDNMLDITSSYFGISSNNTYGWGIYMFSTGASILNTDASTANVFSQNGVNTSISGKIAWPSGTITLW